MALRLGTLGRATHHKQVLCEKAWQVCANFHSDKDLMGDARCLLELPETCHSQSRTALAPSTRHHNNKWLGCNCAPAMLYFTSCSSQKCNNLTRLTTRLAFREIAKCSTQGPVCPKIKSSFHFSSSYVQELKKNGASLLPGHRTTIGSTILLGMRFSLDLAVKVFTL